MRRRRVVPGTTLLEPIGAYYRIQWKDSLPATCALGPRPGRHTCIRQPCFCRCPRPQLDDTLQQLQKPGFAAPVGPATAAPAACSETLAGGTSRHPPDSSPTAVQAAPSASTPGTRMVSTGTEVTASIDCWWPSHPNPPHGQAAAAGVGAGAACVPPEDGGALAASRAEQAARFRLTTSSSHMASAWPPAAGAASLTHAPWGWEASGLAAAAAAAAAYAMPGMDPSLQSPPPPPDLWRESPICATPVAPGTLRQQQMGVPGCMTAAATAAAAYPAVVACGARGCSCCCHRSGAGGDDGGRCEAGHHQLPPPLGTVPSATEALQQHLKQTAQTGWQ